MTLPIKPLLGIMSDNLRRRGSVMPLPGRTLVGWARGLDLPHGGATVLYTGHLYQLMPVIAALEETMISYEDSWLNRGLTLGRLANRVLDVSSLLRRESAPQREAFDRRLASIGRLLQLAGVEFGYLYEEELYSGALAHDLALDDVLAAHARRLRGVLRSHGVRRVITVDPHTTHMLRSVFPQLLDDFRVEVRSYLEVLASSPPPPARQLESEMVFHDSCVYARSEGVVDEPRALLARAGVRVRDPAFARRRTMCCGGPIESLFPSRARAICARRMQELARAGNQVVTSCPICLVNLERAAPEYGVTVRDLPECLLEACEATLPAGSGV